MINTPRRELEGLEETRGARRCGQGLGESQALRKCSVVVQQLSESVFVGGSPKTTLRLSDLLEGLTEPSFASCAHNYGLSH